MAIHLERSLLRAEDWLSIGAAVPFLGGPCGIAKIGMGSVQLISGIAYGILFASSYWVVTKRTKCFFHSWTHIKNGAGNVVSGFIESIPIVGSVSYFIRKELGLRVAITEHREVSGYWAQPLKYNCLTTLGDWLCWRDLNKRANGECIQLKEITSDNISKNYIVTGQEGKLVHYAALKAVEWSLIEDNDIAKKINLLLQSAYDKKAFSFMCEQYNNICKVKRENKGVLELENLETFHDNMTRSYSPEVEHKFQ